MRPPQTPSVSARAAGSARKTDQGAARARSSSINAHTNDHQLLGIGAPRGE
jgi:hypothetical protein